MKAGSRKRTAAAPRRRTVCPFCQKPITLTATGRIPKHPADPPLCELVGKFLDDVVTARPQPLAGPTGKLP